MDITALAKKPALVEVKLDNPEIIAAYGEPVSFWMMDHLGITTYFNFYKVQNSEDDTLLNDLLRKIILRSDGTPALAAGEVLPTNITLNILVAINEQLGKSEPKTVEKETTGTQQK